MDTGSNLNFGIVREQAVGGAMSADEVPKGSRYFGFAFHTVSNKFGIAFACIDLGEQEQAGVSEKKVSVAPSSFQ